MSFAVVQSQLTGKAVSFVVWFVADLHFGCLAGKINLGREWPGFVQGAPSRRRKKICDYLVCFDLIWGETRFPMFLSVYHNGDSKTLKEQDIVEVATGERNHSWGYGYAGRCMCKIRILSCLNLAAVAQFAHWVTFTSCSVFFGCV